MIEIKLQAKNGRLEVINYKIFYPFSINIYDKSRRVIKWNVASLYCVRNQGSFKLFCARVINFSKLQINVVTDDTVGGKIYNKVNVAISEDGAAEQYLYLKNNLLFYANEKNQSSYINDKRSVLPNFLLNNLNGVKSSVHFWLEYDKGHTLLDEEINLQLNLEYDAKTG